MNNYIFADNQKNHRAIPLPVSIIIPVKDGAAFLRRAVASALAQEPLEIIVVNNNSTDNTAQILAALAREHPVVIAENCLKPGGGAARNHGLAKAKGQWVQFLDADDELDENKIAAQISRAEKDVKWIIGGYRNNYPDGAITENIPHQDPWKGLVFRYRIGCTHANLYRRDTLLGMGGWREDLPDNQDTNLHADLLACGAPYLVFPAVGCTYHHHTTAGRVSTGNPVGGNLRKVELLERTNAFLRAQRPEYWRKNSSFFRGALLRTLRVLATHDLGAAAGASERFFKQREGSARPELISGLLWASYQTLGFSRTESLRLGLRRFVPTALKNWLK